MNKLAKLLLIASIGFTSPHTYAQKIEHGQRFRALIIGLDGTKGYQFHQRVFLQNNQAPNLRAIAESGQYATCSNLVDYHCARTHLGPRFDPSYSWVTSSGWAAVLTGVNTNKHLVRENEFEDQAVFYRTSHQYPTFMTQLQRKGFITAAGGVGNFLSSINNAGTDHAHVATGILDFECGIDIDHKTSNVPADAKSNCNVNYRQSFDGDDDERDAKLTHWLVGMINNDSEKSPDAIMGVYDTIDDAGHQNGFSSNPGYMNAISRVDNYIGQVVQAIQNRVSNSHEVWLLVITSDHGGHVNDNGRGGHDKVKFHDEVVPFVVGVFGDHITLANRGQIEASNISQMDVTPSVLHWFDTESTTNDGTVRSHYFWK